MATNKNSNRPYKGLFTDSSSVDQPKGTYTMAWNAINETREGESNFISNEEANASFSAIKSGYTLIGDVYIGDNNTALFSTNGTNSEIGIVDEKGTYTEIVNDNTAPCLGFNIQNQIEAVFRVRRGCERVIYFTDGINPVRYFNFDLPDDFKTGVHWDCELFKLFLEFTPPCFSSFELTESGSLDSGTYCFAIQYLDRDLNPSKWSYLSQPIPIFKSILTSPYKRISGSSNIATDSIGGTGHSTKGINIFLTDLDTTYESYRFGVVHFTNNNGLPAIAYQSGIKSVINGEFFYGGPSDEFVQIDISEIIIDADFISSAKHIEQLENRLVLANTIGKSLNFCDFQKKASLIKSSYVVKTVNSEIIETGNSKDPDTYWHHRGYMGDEVYAFGIVYIFKDGYETPAYHIPGRDLTNYSCGACGGGVLHTTCLQVELKPIKRLNTTASPSHINNPCNCSGTKTSFEIKYTIDPGTGTPGAVQTFTKDITCGDPLGWINIACSQSSLGGNIHVFAITSWTVTNNDCTAIIDSTTAGYRITNITNTVLCPDVEIDPWNEDIAHIYPQSQEAAYNSLSAANQLRQWQIYNTAKPLTATSGQMAYWEAENANYPTILDCAGNDYWGTDFCGTSLGGKAIRHHKFPDRNLIPHIVANPTKVVFVSRLALNLNFAATDPTLTEQEFLSIFGGDLANARTVIVNYNFDGGSGAVAATPLTFSLTGNSFIYDSTTSSYHTYLLEVVIEYAFINYGSSTPTGITSIVTTGTLITTASTGGFNVTATPLSTIAPTQVQSQHNLLNVLGIKFDNIIYPHADIIGHYIVRGDRNEFNRTVIDKGISNPLNEATSEGVNYSLFSWLRGGPDRGTPANTTPNIDSRSTTNSYFIGPDLLFNRTGSIGRYLKKENEFQFYNKWIKGNQGYNDEFDDLTEFGSVNGSAVFGDGTAYLSSARYMTYNGVPAVQTPVMLRPITESLVMMPLARSENFIDGRMLFNVSHTNPVQILKLEIIASGGGVGNIIRGMSANFANSCIPYVSIKIDRDVHPDLFAINYFRTHNCMYINTGTTNDIYGGDTFISPLNLPNTLIWGVNNSVWDLVASIIGLVSSVVLTVVTYGAAAPLTIAVAIAATAGTVAAVVNEAYDQYIAGMEWVTRRDNNIVTGNISAVHDYDTFTTKNALIFASEFASNIYVESTMNISLRQDDVRYKGGNEYFKDLRANIDGLLKHVRNRFFFFREGNPPKDSWGFKSVGIPETYLYNKDYSVFNELNAYYPLGESYNCCSGCIESFPTRVSYSQQSFQEEAGDNYRVFLANNYKDIEAEKGEITNLIRSKNNLLIHTEESLYVLPQNVQERVTDDLISFIGTGEYFSIPPRLMVDDDIGTAGSVDKWATVKTPNGIFFVDRNTGQAFLTTAKGLQPAIIGMRNFFKENLKLIFAQQYYELIGSEFPNTQNPANPNGIGMHAIYDYRHKRIILTKRDYKIVSTQTDDFKFTDKASGSASGLVDGGLVYSSYTGKFGLGTGTTTYTELVKGFHDQSIFENKSWTLSYSFLSNTWVSFHSYIPLYMYPIHNNFISVSSTEGTAFTAWSNTHQLWKHGVVGTYQKFYGTRYKHILEYISLSSPIETTLFDEIILQTIAKKYSTANQEFIDERFVTFNKAMLHNSRQTTGQLTLTPKNQDTSDYLSNQVKNTANNEITIDRSERDWKINELRDYRIDYTKSIFTKDWTSLKVEFPIDKVINTSSISFTKDWFDLQPLRDKYLIIRFIFDNLDDVKLTTNYTFEIENKSFR